MGELPCRDLDDEIPAESEGYLIHLNQVAPSPRPGGVPSASCLADPPPGRGLERWSRTPVQSDIVNLLTRSQIPFRDGVGRVGGGSSGTVGAGDAPSPQSMAGVGVASRPAPTSTVEVAPTRLSVTGEGAITTSADTTTAAPRNPGADRMREKTSARLARAEARRRPARRRSPKDRLSHTAHHLGRGTGTESAASANVALTSPCNQR